MRPGQTEKSEGNGLVQAQGLVVERGKSFLLKGQIVVSCLRLLQRARENLMRLKIVVVTAILAASLGVLAEPTSAKVLRVCADPDYLPYSNRAGQGFENKIAQAVAKALGETAEYTLASYRGPGGLLAIPGHHVGRKQVRCRNEYSLRQPGRIDHATLLRLVLCFCVPKI
jgi:ABC-type amino acid transport substrate-binding protein